MQRIYAWTPDECIPEFYSDPSIFVSRHRELGLDDLQVPGWCGSPEGFIAWHRQVLESDDVSRQLNDWVDITFGYKLSGDAAVEAKNVPLRGNKQSSRRSAFVQLFDRPHPKRMLGGGMREEEGEDEKGEGEVKGEVKGEERKEGEEESPTTNGEVALDNGEAESTAEEGETTASTAAAPVSIDYSIRNLHLLQEAASFDAVFTALEGCYDPIHGHPTAAPITSDSYEEEDFDDVSTAQQPRMESSPPSLPPPCFTATVCLKRLHHQRPVFLISPLPPLHWRLSSSCTPMTSSLSVVSSQSYSLARPSSPATPTTSTPSVSSSLPSPPSPSPSNASSSP